MNQRIEAPEVERQHEPLRDAIASVMGRWVSERPGDDYWRSPLVGVAAAEDPMFALLPRVVDPEHAMPGDLLSGARSVIVFFLPFLREVGSANDASGRMAARGWAEAYVATNSLIGEICLRLSDHLADAGHRSAVTPATHNFDAVKLVSRWSHKHLGYIAGLGTFGIHHMLITSAGCCGRLGSVVTTMPLPRTSRPDREFCLEKAGIECSACVPKCMRDALGAEPFDRRACYAQCLENDKNHADLPLVDVCGKCACGVPCSHEAPNLP